MEKDKKITSFSELLDKKYGKKGIERDASDIRLSTLMRIIEQGLGGTINISINI